MRFLLVLIPALLLAPVAAGASPEEAERLRNDILELLGETNLGMAPDVLSFDEVEVLDRGGDSYRVTISGLGLRKTKKRELLEIGDVAATIGLLPEGRYAFSEVDLPPRLVIRDDAGQERGTVKPGLERLSGIWWPELDQVAELDLLLRGFEVRVPDESALVAAAEISADFALVPEADGRVRQRQDVRLKDFLVSQADTLLEIGAIEGSATIDDLDLETLRTLLAVMDDLVLAGETGDLQRGEALKKSLGGLFDVASAARQSLVMRDFSVRGKGPADSMTLGELRLTLDVAASEDQQLGRVAFGFAGDGLAFSGGPQSWAESYRELLPQRWNLPIAVDGVPLDLLSQVLVDLVFDASKTAILPDDALMSAGDALWAGLRTAGARLLIEDLLLEAPAARLTGRSLLTLAEKDPGLVGQAEFLLTGLDRVLAVVEGLTDNSVKTMLSGAVLTLMGLGQAQALEDGSVGYRFGFTFTPDGKLLLNGKAFGEGLFGAPQQQ